MSINLKKRILMDETYKPKNILKHKHNYCLKHLLIITNINENASSNYYNSKEYYYVLKCNKCNSFIPDSIDGNFCNHIFENEIIDENLPVITADTMQKNPHYSFNKLTNVKVK